MNLPICGGSSIQRPGRSTLKPLVILAVTYLALCGPSWADSAAADTYLPPASVVPYGAAPRATEHLVSSADGQETYALILYDGDEVFTALTDFATRHAVTAAHFTAIGAVHDVKIGWLDLKRKQYKINSVGGQVEVLALIGDVGATSEGKSLVHAHLVVGLPDGQTRGGHLVHAITSPTVEIFITTGKAVLHKAPDAASGMTMFK